jgi:two-component system, chemotaxis family, sensor kinase CheA
MTQFSDERGAELRELFFESAQELLQTLNQDALKLEKNPSDVETIRNIRRIVHTLKGDAAATGCRELSELAHELEDALALEAISSEVSLAEIAFTAADTFGAMLASYRQQAKLPSTQPLQELVQRLAAGSKTAKPRKRRAQKTIAGPVQWTEYEKLAMQKAAQLGKCVYHIQASIDPHCAMPIAARQLVLNALAAAGKVLGTRPEAGSPEVAKEFHVLLASEQTSEFLVAKCHIPTVISQVAIEKTEDAKVQEGKIEEPKENVVADPDGSATPDGETGKQTQTGASQQPPTPSFQEQDKNGKPQPLAVAPDNILRVDAERIDNVLNLLGELIIGKSMLQQVHNEFAKHYPREAMRGRFADALAVQGRVLNDLQRAVMKVRMVPVEQLFRRFPRMVRDVAKQCGKEVDLVLRGGDTDLDKSLLDAIAEPLTHLVRNAISHGIESAQERAAKGKPERGTLRLEAYHQGNQVVIEVADDGRGIDTQKVKNRALEKHLLTTESAATLTETDILGLIFRPGFSTADEITEIAGRGVGLDVVQSVLHRLKGTVEVEPRPGKGATFRLKLPLTLAIIKALLFRVEQRLYAIPLNTVAEIARAHESDLHQVDNCEVLQLRKQVLPVVRLGRPAQLDSPSSGQSSKKIFILVIALGERKLGLLVEALEGEEQLVIKALDDQTVETDLVSGASILGDGRVVLILNLAAIVERFSRSRPDAGKSLSFGLLLSHAERARASLVPTGVPS